MKSFSSLGKIERHQGHFTPFYHDSIQFEK